MKRVSGIMIVLIIIWLNAWSMTPVSDAALSGVTGQAGVSINPDVTMNIHIDTAAWGDSTGLDGFWDPMNSDSGGYMGVHNLGITNLHVKSRETDNYGGYDNSWWKPVTIDVATDPGGVTFVRIGLGSLQVSWDSLWLEVVNGTSGPTLNQKLGEFYLGGLELYLNPESFIDIYNDRTAGGVGVNLFWYSIVDHINISALSWGDSDGLPGGNNGDGVTWMAPGGSAGYVGLSRMYLENTSVIGAFAIDVNTSYSGVYADQAGGPVSVVHVSFPTDFCLHTGRMGAEVKLDSIPQLDSTNAGTLGDIFIDQVDLTILNGSWVDLWAH